MKKSSIWSVLIALGTLLVFGVSCSFPIKFQKPQPTPIAVSNLLLASISATPSPTPFLPDSFQATPTPQILAVEQLAGTDNLNSKTSPFSSQEDRVNILFLGSDWRPNMGYRTDVILLISINSNDGTVSLISFPRDLYITLPGIGQQRINVAQESGGFELTQKVFAENFNIRLDYFVMTNFSGFMSLVDTLGGIQINAGISLYDTCKFNWASEGYCYIAPGINFFDGQTALWYVRSRASTSDIDRLRRAQEVLVGIFRKLMSLDAVARAPELFSLLANCIETDLKFEQIAELIPLAPSMLSDESRISRYAVGWTEVTSYIVPESGAQVLLPNYDAINALLQNAFSK